MTGVQTCALPICYILLKVIFFLFVQFGERGSVNDLILNSPFYIGRTTYGGASSASYRRSIGSTSLSSSPANSEKLAKHTIKVKPGHAQSNDDTSMSQTAKRILATLEQFSTPILDAKRIPVSQEPVLSSLGSRKRSRADDGGNSPLVLEQPRVPQRTPNKPLHWAKGAPRTSQLTIPVVPDTLIHRRREIVQDATSGTTPASIFSGNVDTYKLRTETDNSNAIRNTLKMKPKHRHNEKEPKEPEMPSEVNLPEISLPISKSSLPTFDISVPAPKPVAKSPQSSVASSVGVSPASLTSSGSKPTASSTAVSYLKSQDAAADSSFSFSSPIRVSTVLTVKEQPLTPVNNFTFSKPLSASAKFSEPSLSCVSARPKAIDSMKQDDVSLGGLKPASELKTGSVMDILGKGSNSSTSTSSSTNGSVSLMDKFKPAAGTWVCDSCFIRNKSDLSKCAACSNPREVKNPTSLSGSTATTTTSNVSLVVKSDSGFGAQFKMAQGMWECSACMVRNKDTDTKCVSCTTAKPGAAAPKPVTPAASLSGWGDKFKPPSNSWECSVCMVRNGSELTACQSCTTAKPGASVTAAPPVKNSWGDQFKKPEGTWQCSDCMVSNKASDLKCIACSGKKPGSASGPPSPKQNTKFNFGVPASADTGSSKPSFSFGIPKDSKENSPAGQTSVTSSTGFKFGESKPAAVPASGFSFGVPAASTPSATDAKAVNTASAGPPAIALPVTTSSNLFGVKTTSSDSKPSDVQPVATEGSKPAFSFGVTQSTASPMFAFGKPSLTAATSLPSSSSSSPTGGKRKLGDDAPTSSASPKSALVSVSQPAAVSLAKPVITSSSSVSSTSGPVFSFSPASNTTSTSSSTLLSTSVSSTANSQNANGAKVNIFNLVSSPSSSTVVTPSSAFSAGTATLKDESVSSTWKQPSSSNAANLIETKPSLDMKAGTGIAQPAFGFGSTVSSSGMAFGANTSTSAAVPTFSFGSNSDKPASTNKLAPTFGSPASSTTLFGSNAGGLGGATPSFGSTSGTGFASLTSAANPLQSTSSPSQTFQASSAPSFNSPSASAFTSSFGTILEDKKSGFPFSVPSGEKKQGFSFSAPDVKKPEDQNKPTFSFTATTAAQNSFQSSSASVFTFGASAPVTNGPAKNSFAFGNQASSFPTPSFLPSQPSSSSGFNFGAPNSTPAFGSASNSTAQPSLSFESASPAPMFSAPSTFTGFGSANPGSAGAFNFSPATSFGAQNQPPAAAPSFSFDSTQKPSFSFTNNAAPVNFQATPQDAAVAGTAQRRKIRAARKLR